MTNPTATATTITAVRLSCNHSITGDDILGLSGMALEKGVGAKVSCPKCPLRKVSSTPPSRRIKAIVEAPVSAPVWTPEPTDTGADHGPVASAQPVMTITVPPTANPGPNRYDVAAARDEHKALQAWDAAGRQGDRPDTSNLDALNAAHAAGQPRPRRQAGQRRTVSPIRQATIDARKEKKLVGRGQRVTDDELVMYCGDLRRQYPDATSNEVRDYGLWVGGRSYSYARWAKAWDATTPAD